MLFGAGDISAFLNQRLGDTQRLDKMNDMREADRARADDANFSQMRKDIAREMDAAKIGVSPSDLDRFTSSNQLRAKAYSTVQTAQTSGIPGGDRTGPGIAGNIG